MQGKNIRWLHLQQLMQLQMQLQMQMQQQCVETKKRLGIKSLSLILNTVALLFASLKSLTNYLYVCLFFCLPVCLSASLCDSFHIPP